MSQIQCGRRYLELWRSYHRAIHFRKLFSRAIEDSVCWSVYNYLASNLAILEKNIQRFNIFGLLVELTRGYRHVRYSFRNLFLQATFYPPDSIPLSRTVKIYKFASKLTALIKYATKCNRYSPYNVRPWGTTVSRYTFLGNSRQAGVKLQFTCNATIHRFRDIRCQLRKSVSESQLHQPQLTLSRD